MGTVRQVSALYNENDPYAARWLENLVAAGHIAPGAVSAKSIVDLEGHELAGVRQAHFFAGIGVWSAALPRCGLARLPAVSGPAPAHVSLSAARAKARGLLTSGTYGQPGSGSSSSIALTSSLASRLKARLDGRGSTLFSLTWKEQATPAGRSFSLRGAWARRGGARASNVLGGRRRARRAAVGGNRHIPKRGEWLWRMPSNWRAGRRGGNRQHEQCRRRGRKRGSCAMLSNGEQSLDGSQEMTGPPD